MPQLDWTVSVSAIDLCADVGLVAMSLATVNICLGLLIAVRYSPVRYWPHRLTFSVTADTHGRNARH